MTSRQVKSVSQSISRDSKELLKNKMVVLQQRMEEGSEIEFYIPSTEEEGWFLGFGDHNVTGKELNKVVRSIQTNLYEARDFSISNTEQIKAVYDVLDVLDKHYIQKILAAQLTAEQAHKSAVKKIDELESYISNIKDFSNTQKTAKRLDEIGGSIDEIEGKVESKILVLNRRIRLTRIVAAVGILASLALNVLLILGIL